MLTNSQLSVIEKPIYSKIFLSGVAGTGKTTTAVERMKFLLQNDIPAGKILVLTPQRTLQDPYLEVLHSPEITAGSEVTPATIGGLSRRMVDLFWPLAAELAGFAHPENPPVFLTLETAQYYMTYLVRPHLEEGWFSSVVMNRNRLSSQILDNLNKAAMIGFSHHEIGERLTSSWSGEIAQRRVYEDTQECASEFRQFCLEHNLLDFSLQLEIFSKILWGEPTVQTYLCQSYQHLIIDNIEEDIPVAHDILAEWLQQAHSALLIYDENAGYRRFLGADPESGLELSHLCNESAYFSESFVISEPVAQLANSLHEIISLSNMAPQTNRSRECINIISARFYPELLDAVSNEIKHLMEDEGIPASEIVILSPFLNDTLRFSLSNRLDALGIPKRSHRPSRSLRDEPASQCLLTLAALAHPDWGIRPTKTDVIHALMQSIENLDLVRAQLLVEIVYRQKECTFSNFEQIKPEMQNRITYLVGARFGQLKAWLDIYRQEETIPLDHFLRRLFGEILSQAGFGFHSNLDSASVTASLIESVQKFRWAMEPTLENITPVDIGKEYIAMLQDGVIAAQYVSAWSTPENDAVLIAPAYTFLMSNQPVSVQFWLDASSGGWHERLFQPLTHPYVLSRHWPPGRLWTDSDEVQANNASMERLLTGLLHRCRNRIYLGLTDLSESGYEQRGALIMAFQKVLQST